MLELEGEGLYKTLLVALGALFLLTKLSQPKDDVSSNVNFQQFQSHFVYVYLIMMMADWLQGPTVFKLYQYYGFSRQENATLFIAGFGASMIFGAFAGTFADKYGRKLCCQIYGVTYGLCCLTKHVNSYPVLMLGRILGGFSTSILWSAFEAWMISEHNRHGFSSEWIGGTFSMMIQRNGLVAILSGFIAEAAVSFYDGHPVAPFDVSLTCLIIGTLIITFTWTENHGDTQSSQTAGLTRAVKVIMNDKKVLTIGIIQSLFEGSMYTFVFGWTPRLEESGKVPLGFVFSSFMISCSIGATVFAYLSKNGRSEEFMVGVFLFAAFCMIGAVISDSPLITMLSFCGFELCVGIFWPSIMSLRSEYLPEEGRATIMNLFRIPLNAFVCLILFNQESLSVRDDFKLCAVALTGCAYLTKKLDSLPSSVVPDLIVKDASMDPEQALDDSH